MDYLFDRVIRAERESRVQMAIVAVLVSTDTPIMTENVAAATQIDLLISEYFAKLNKVNDEITGRLAPRIRTAKSTADKLKTDVDQLFVRSTLTSKPNNFLLMTLDDAPAVRNIGTSFQNLATGWKIQASYGDEFYFNNASGTVAFNTDTIKQYRVIIRSTFFTSQPNYADLPRPLQMQTLLNLVAVDVHDEFNNSRREYTNGLFNVDRTYVFEAKGACLLIPQIRTYAGTIPMEWIVNSYIARNEFRVEEL